MLNIRVILSHKKVWAATNDGRRLERNDYRGATATTENRIPLQRLQGQSRQEQP